jgi:uncharacterized damage-inducible protein DinB
MRIADLFLSELDREEERSKRALQNVPDGKHDWKAHEKSLTLGYTAQMVALIPSWVARVVTADELDLKPPKGARHSMPPMDTSAALLAAHQQAIAAARSALQDASDEHLMEPWRLLVAGQVVAEQPRHVAIRDMINHLAHHRGQMTVYLRLLGAPVPALYGPSADDKRFTLDAA